MFMARLAQLHQGEPLQFAQAGPGLVAKQDTMVKAGRGHRRRGFLLLLPTLLAGDRQGAGDPGGLLGGPRQ